MAAKKSFKGANPAMQFISIVPSEPETVVEAVKPEAVVEDAAPMEALPVVGETKIKPSQEKHAPAKKTPPVPVVGEEEAERKTKRLNLLLQPSMLEDLGKIAHMKQKSVNDLINTVLKEYCGENPSLIKKYDDVFGV